MSHQTIAEITSRSMDDLSFARKLKSDPETVLSEYEDLTDEEESALKEGNQNKVNKLLGPEVSLLDIAGIIFPSSGSDK